MPGKISSALQLGFGGLTRRMGWRLKMGLKVARFKLLARTNSERLVQPGHYACIAGPVASYIADLGSIRECCGRSGVFSEAQQARITSMARQVFSGSVEVRGTGEVALQLDEGNWYCYDDDVALMVNRHDFLLPLVQSQLLSNTDEFRKTFTRLFCYWADNFSTQRLIAHDKPIDAAIRLLNWLWVFQFGYLHLDEAGQHKLLKTIYLQVEYTIAWCSAGGNHLVLEALGVYVYGCLFSGTDYGRRWKQWGRRKLLQEVVREVAPDGVHTEQSTFYHQTVATHFLKFYLTATRNSDELGDVFIQRLQNMLEYVHQSMKPDLTHPILGDGNLLVTDDREHWESKVLLAARAQLFGKPLYSGFSKVLNDSSIWFLGTPAADIELSQKAPASAVYAQSGIAVFRDKGNYLLFDAAAFGDLEFPHHGHADALGFEMMLHGQNLFVDAGGYGYLNDPFRRYFRGTHAHNTLVVDGRDQSELFGVFGYGKLARVSLGKWRLSESLDFVEAEHDGYAPIIHKRQIFFHKRPETYILIVDFLSGEGVHDIEHLLHLASDASYDGGTSVATMGGGSDKAHIQCFSSQPMAEQTVRGREDGHIQGWVSLHTSEKRPGDVVIRKSSCTLPLYIVTLITSTADDISCKFDRASGLIEVHGTRTENIQLDMKERSAVFFN